MKLLLLPVLMILFLLPAFSQSTDTSTYVLGVFKPYKNHTQFLGFKPGKQLKIKTRQGALLSSHNYTFSGQMIVLDARDTILLDDIQWIRGKVVGNAGLKAIGVVLLGYSGMASLAIPVAALMTADPWTIAMAATATAVYGLGGLKLLGPRKFRSSNQWEVRHMAQEKVLKLPRFQ